MSGYHLPPFSCTGHREGGLQLHLFGGFRVHVVDWIYIVGPGCLDVQIPDPAVIDAIDPAMDCNGLPVRPRVL